MSISPAPGNDPAAFAKPSAETMSKLTEAVSVGTTDPAASAEATGAMLKLAETISNAAEAMSAGPSLDPSHVALGIIPPAAILGAMTLFYRLVADKITADIATVKADIKKSTAEEIQGLKKSTAEEIQGLKKSTAQLLEKFQSSIIEKIDDNSKLLLETTKREATEKALDVTHKVLSVSVHPTASPGVPVPPASTNVYASASPPK